MASAARCSKSQIVLWTAGHHMERRRVLHKTRRRCEASEVGGAKQSAADSAVRQLTCERRREGGPLGGPPRRGARRSAQPLRVRGSYSPWSTRAGYTLATFFTESFRAMRPSTFYVLTEVVRNLPVTGIYRKEAATPMASQSGDISSFELVGTTTRHSK